MGSARGRNRVALLAECKTAAEQDVVAQLLDEVAGDGPASGLSGGAERDVMLLSHCFADRAFGRGGEVVLQVGLDTRADVGIGCGGRIALRRFELALDK